jgi:hypothetical protein
MTLVSAPDSAQAQAPCLGRVKGMSRFRSRATEGKEAKFAIETKRDVGFVL